MQQIKPHHRNTMRISTKTSNQTPSQIAQLTTAKLQDTGNYTRNEDKTRQSQTYILTAGQLDNHKLA